MSTMWSFLVVVTAMACSGSGMPAPAVEKTTERAQPRPDEVKVAATTLLTMYVPRPATPRDFPVANYSIGALGYSLGPGLDLSVQRNVLDGDCRLGDDELEMPKMFPESDVKREKAPGMDLLVAAGTLTSSTGVRVAITTIITCKGPELLYIVATSIASTDPSEIARVRAIAVRAASTLQPADGVSLEPSRVAATAELTMLVPTPATRITDEQAPTRIYKVPGASGLAVSELAHGSKAECAAWLDASYHEVKAAEHRVAAELITDRATRMTERGVDVVLYENRQRGKDGQWFANVGAAVCKGGAPLEINAISNEGMTSNGNVPRVVTERLRRFVIQAATSLQAR